MIELVSYNNNYKADFRRLNIVWLEKFGLLESHDLEILDDPDGTVIARGGLIFLAKEGDVVVGTAGLWKENEEEYELIKMAVDPEWQGKGISKILLERCLSEVKDRNAKKIFLYSNSQLKTAISLYTKYGFKHVDVKDAPFETADVKMELEL